MFKDGAVTDPPTYFPKEFWSILVPLNSHVTDIRDGYVTEILHVNVTLWPIIPVTRERVNTLISAGTDMLKDIERMKKETKTCHKTHQNSSQTIKKANKIKQINWAALLEHKDKTRGTLAHIVDLSISCNGFDDII